MSITTKPQVIKRGQPAKYPFSQLNEVGTFFTYPKDVSFTNQSRSIRASAQWHGIKVSVRTTVNNEWLVERVA